MSDMSGEINNDDDDKSNSDSCSIVLIREGDLCPNCGFARLKKEPGNIIRCPICGYGNGAGCT